MEDNSWTVELTDKSQIWEDVQALDHIEPPASSSSPSPDDEKLSGWRFTAIIFV